MRGLEEQLRAMPITANLPEKPDEPWMAMAKVIMNTTEHRSCKGSRRVCGLRALLAPCYVNRLETLQAQDNRSDLILISSQVLLNNEAFWKNKSDTN